MRAKCQKQVNQSASLLYSFYTCLLRFFLVKGG
jgi:hypothetical protein